MKRLKLFRVVSFLIILALVSSFLVSCESDKTKDDKDKDPKEESGVLFWEVTSQDGKKLYLLGSIHVADDSIYPFSDVVMDAFEECSALAVEADIEALEKDTQLQLEMIQELMYDDGSTIEDHIDEELFTKAKEFLEENDLYIDYYLLFKPVFWADVVSSVATEESGLSHDKGVDMFFIKEAKKAKKEVLEIESVMDQAKMLGGFSDSLQAIYLLDALNNVETAKADVKALYELWKEADVKKFEEYVTRDVEMEGVPEELIEAYSEFEKAMLTDRNEHMVNKAIEYIKSGKTVFYVVGAAHMVGESGLVNQLESKGYEVTKR